jgi:site-specific recombinase XerD
MEKHINEFKQMVELRGLTDNTLKTYSSYLREFLSYVNNYLVYEDVNQVTWAEIRGYILFLKNTRRLNPRSINAHIAQLRFFFLYVLHKPWDYYQVPTLKFDTYLPFVLSQEEVHKFIDTLENLKHKAILSLMYSAGLRVSEACNLKYSDISRNKMAIHIRRAKNRSDRYAMLSENALAILTEYWFAFGKPKDWIFPSTFKNGKSIVPFTVHRFIKDHEKRLGWESRISCHTMRHCFGTHLYENGADLIAIKNAMGHKSLNSTAIYVSLAVGKQSSILSPFDIKIAT